MPVACSTQTLTGQSGSLWFTPAGTSACLLAADITAAGIALPATNDFKVGDPVKFTAEGSATADTNIAFDTTFYIESIANNVATVAATKGGAAVAPAGDATTPGGTHINMRFDEFEAVCNVSTFNLDITRARIDTTSLPCGLGAGGGKYAPFRTYQSGFADGTGSMTVRFTAGAASLANRLLANSMLRDQSGAMARFFVDTQADTTGAAVDLDASSYIEAPISIEGLSFSVGTDDSPTEASINFSFTGQPTKLFGITL